MKLAGVCIERTLHCAAVSEKVFATSGLQSMICMKSMVVVMLFLVRLSKASKFHCLQHYFDVTYLVLLL